MTKTDNQIIAEFMGDELQKFESNYAYHLSWDALRPVIEKINGMYINVYEFRAVVELAIVTPLQEVYNEVVKFIKWYNSNRP
jgi:hypothetical protein